MKPLMDEQLKKVLLVDDDPGLLFPLSKDLSMNQDMYRLVLAENGQEALEILAKESISLVVSDVNMPGINGFDLLAAVREQYPQIGVILMTAYGTDKMRRLVNDCGCLHFLEKPFRFEKLKELIKKQIAEKEVGFNGTLKNILLTDLIQICCIAGADMAIKVSNGPSEGVFYIESGEVIHAECGEEIGEPAFFRIVGWESGSFESFSVERFPEPTINRPYMYLLMEGSRQSDESTGGSPEENFKEGIEADAATDASPSTEPINLMEEMGPAGRDDLDSSPDDALPDFDALEASLDETLSEKTLRVMIVDDSAIMCRILSDTLSESDRIEVAGTAKNGQEALKKIEELKPDLITLDVNMPVMGGQTALKHIMIKNRCPVVIISSLNTGSYQNILDFLLLGAVDFIGKPVNNEDVANQKRRIIGRIINAGKAHTNNFIRYKPPVAVRPENKTEPGLPGQRIVIIHSGAGGYVELVQLVSMLPSGSGVSLVVLHDMAHEFMTPLSNYLQERSHLNVSILSPNQVLQQECCYLGTSDALYSLGKSGSSFVLDTLGQGAENNSGSRFQMTCADGENVLSILLSGARSGIGPDSDELKNKGGRIIVKDPKSCMLPYSLEEAIRSGAATETAGLNEIAGQILGFYKQTV